LHHQGRLPQARLLYQQVLQLQPRHFDALNNLAVIELQSNPQRAAELLGNALMINPRSAAAHNNRGNALRELKRHRAALVSYEQAIALQADYTEAHNNRGATLADLNQYEAAIASYERAIALKPDFADAFYNLGNAQHELKRDQAAIASYDRAIALRADFAASYNNRGVALADCKHYQAAIASYEQALALEPDYTEAYKNRASALLELKQYQAAIASYDRAIALQPDIDFVHGTRLLARMQICDWENVDIELAELNARIDRNEVASVPFDVLALSGSATLQKKAAQIWVQHCHPQNPALPPIEKHRRRERIRLGYFSADFREHATLHLMAGLFETHDRSRFELSVFSFGPPSQEPIRTRLEAACEDFIDVRQKSDREIALLGRERHIDIAIDLKGFTQDNRAGIFALRAAPLQVSYLGYPGTMGAPYIDYLIADRTVIPESSLPDFSEKIVTLPYSYQVNDAKRAISDRAFSREDCGLPRTAFVFCCFNNCYKITPAVFAIWMRILSQVEGSVLWLLEDNPTASDNLRREAVRAGVNAERVVFAARLAAPEHLARHRLADLFLDTLPCNAHTTASDALWAGLPVLTCLGSAFAARVAASLLNTIGLPELIISTLEQYQQLAVALAGDAQRLAHIRQRLAEHRLTSPLFDTRLFTTHLEAAYSRIYERYQADLPAEHIAVAAP